ncbi:MAG: protein kinase, partial [Tissierellia bacterium]|nr:protein kinase [Tissierellia bacterium]
MKLINGNLKIVEEYTLNKTKEAYIVESLEAPGENLLLELFEGNSHQMLIKDYINFHVNYKNVSHKYILKTIDFKRVDTINLKPVYGSLFYSLSEYTDWKRLDAIKTPFSETEMASIFIKLFQTIDYLHFRGFTYNYLTPDNIFISEDHDIKISSIAKVIECSYYSEKHVDNYKYLAPELFNSETKVSFKSDYFSLGLLLEDFMLPSIDKNN